MSNVNPGLINPVNTAVTNWGGYHQKVLDEMTIGGVSPYFINHGLLIRG